LKLLNLKTDKALKRTRDTWFRRAIHLFDRPTIDEAVWSELEELLISADIGINTTEKLINRLRKRVAEERINDGSLVRPILKAEMVNILNIFHETASHDPTLLKVTLVVGVNGSGKTTSIAKLAYSLKNNNKKVMLVASDTFRAAAIDQLRYLAEKVGVDIILISQERTPGQ